MAKSHEVIELSVASVQVPTKVYREYRHNVRASIGKKHAILRLPRFLRKNQERQYMDWMQTWLEKQFDRNHSFKARFQQRTYRSGQSMSIGDQLFTLELLFEERKTLASSISGKVIKVKLNKDMSADEWQEHIPALISRAIGKHELPRIKSRVAELNDQFFKKPVNAIRMKYNVSNWGSCSQKGNINLSTRMLFAPEWVQDYIIIHELAHRIEMNHSRNFWRLVEEAMPDYGKAVKWLKDNGDKCYF